MLKFSKSDLPAFIILDLIMFRSFEFWYLNLFCASNLVPRISFPPLL